MELQRRFFQPPKQSFFLFGPRGTGKSTWLRHAVPDGLVIDLLQVLGGWVLRGGFFNNSAESIRIAVRSVNDPDHRGNLVGFRLVISRR